MRIKGIEIQEDALFAGRKAMVGHFGAHNVASAIYAKLPESELRRRHLSHEASNRLLQSERKAGRIAYDRKSMTWTRA